MKRIVILGSTGSVGKNALEIVRAHPKRFKVVGLAADSNVDELSISPIIPRYSNIHHHDFGRGIY